MKLPILYHGTDYRLLEMSVEDRLAYFNLLEETIRVLDPLLSPYFEQYQKNGLQDIPNTLVNSELKNNFINSFMMFRASKLDASQYKYDKDGLYLTNAEFRAKNYALRSFAGGEYGLIAYRFIQYLSQLGLDKFNISNKLKENIQVIRNFAESNASPIILSWKNLDSNYLRSESGRVIEESEIPLYLTCSAFSFKYEYEETNALMDSAIKTKVN